MAERFLIINADDLGYDPNVSRGILQAMRKGVVSSTTLMVNTPYSEDAAQQSSGLSLGLHFNLARFPALSSSFPSEHLASDGTLDERKAPFLSIETIRGELLAQLRRFEHLCGRRPSHLDSHKHLHRLPKVLEAVCAVAVQERLPVRALDAPMRESFERAGIAHSRHFIGDAGTEPYWTWARFEKAVWSLKEGTTELMCHPGFANSHVASGYSKQREEELATFLNPDAAPLLARANVERIDFSRVTQPAS